MLENGKEKRVTHEIQIDKVFNSKMTEIFQGSDIKQLIQSMLALIKTQVEHPALPKSGFGAKASFQVSHSHLLQHFFMQHFLFDQSKSLLTRVHVSI